MISPILSSTSKNDDFGLNITVQTVIMHDLNLSCWPAGISMARSLRTYKVHVSRMASV